MSADTYRLHYETAVARPSKARRYVRSITDTLAHPGIAETERARLAEALRGLRDGLAEHPACERCGRTIESGESVARGLGSHCARAVAS